MEHCKYALKCWNPKRCILLLLHLQAAAIALQGPGSVKIVLPGDSTIEYKYDKSYKDYNKYWCHGYYPRTCTVIADSNGKGKEIVEVKDDKMGSIDVIIKEVIPDGDYWCGIEMHGLDLMTYTDLRIVTTEGVYSALYPIKIRCNYDSQYKDSAKVWCKQNTSLCCDGFALNGSCVTINQGKGQLVDLKDEGVFLVELSAFTSAEQGVYWCAVMDGDAIIKLQEFKLFNECKQQSFFSTFT
ncbi:UNVERIFIED_CONTAM: hypothetical protein FKN15_045900 [Acipenser sinensis]